MKCKQNCAHGKICGHCGNCDCKKGCENKPEVKPDILILGKAISGGDVSCFGKFLSSSR
jgi:acetylornithine/succinyldiaminopimelate/putrescine aminotransferase